MRWGRKVRGGGIQVRLEGENGKGMHRKGGNLTQIEYNVDEQQFHFNDVNTLNNTGFIPCYQSDQKCPFILQLSHSPNIIKYLNYTFNTVAGVWQHIVLQQSNKLKLIKLNPLGDDCLYDFQRVYNGKKYWCKIILDMYTSQPTRFYCVVNTELQCQWKYNNNQWNNYTVKVNKTIIDATRKGKHTVDITVQVHATQQFSARGTMHVDNKYRLDFDRMVQMYIPESNGIPCSNSEKDIRFILSDMK